MLLNARLFPDMFAFTVRCRALATRPRTAAHGSPGSTHRGMRTTKTIAELRTRIAETVAFLKTLDAEKIDGCRPGDHLPARPK